MGCNDHEDYAILTLLSMVRRSIHQIAHLGDMLGLVWRFHEFGGFSPPGLHIRKVVHHSSQHY
jgi:hypothetical protein